jgi:hypothetical protein
METDKKKIYPIDSLEARKKAHDTLFDLMQSEDEKVRLRASIQYFKLFPPRYIQDYDYKSQKIDGTKLFY